MARRKLWGVVLDCDGTLFRREIRSLISVFDRLTLPPKAKRETDRLRQYYLPLAMEGRLTPEETLEWLRLTLEIYVRHRVTMKHVHEAMRTVRFRPGVRKCLRLLKKANIPVAIISYGVEPLIREAVALNGAADLVQEIYAAQVSLNRRGRFMAHHPDSYVIPENKGLWSRRFAERYGIGHSRLLAVGDSAGDRKLGTLRRNRLGIAENAREADRIRRYMGRVVVTDDFSPVIDWIREKTDLI